MFRVLRRSFSKVSGEQVRLLRDMTGAPLLQCKNVLTECEGDIEKAKAILREKNLIFADRKVGATAGEGVVFVHLAMGIPHGCR
jgi:elongation factor Ts